MRKLLLNDQVKTFVKSFVNLNLHYVSITNLFWGLHFFEFTVKTLAATTTMLLKPDKASGSQPQTKDQGEMAQLGKHGRILRPLTLETDSLLPPIGVTAPAPPQGGKRATVTPDGWAAKRDARTSRTAGQARCSRVPPIGAAAPAPPQGGKRATVAPDGGAAKSEAVTSRPAPQARCSRVPPIGAAAPAPPQRGQRATVTPDGLAVSCISSQMHLKPNKATASQSQTMDQGIMAKLGKHGRILRPLDLGTYSKVLSSGVASPASSSRSKRAIATADGGPAMRDEGTFRQTDQRYSPFSHPMASLHQLRSREARGQRVP